jgi:hypothetical protein
VIEAVMCGSAVDRGEQRLTVDAAPASFAA